MKKCLIFLFVLTFLVTAGVIVATAATQNQTETVYCERCSKYIPAEEWMEWTITGGDLLQEGHYYLADTFTAQETTINIPALKFVCLDLRGNTWTTEGIRPLTVAGDLSILDSVGGGLILTTGAHLHDGGFAAVSNAGALNIYGGTIQRIVRDDITLYHGGLIDIAGGAVNLYGGTLSGGVVKGIKVDGTAKTPRGGNVYMDGGTLGVYGGTITGGMAIFGTSSSAQGGNVYATTSRDGKTARIVISAGTVTDGYSDWDGGNFYFGTAELTLTDSGSIADGHAVRHGGNMEMSAESTVVSLLGGTVTGGVAGGTLASSTSSQSGGGGGNIFGYMGTLRIADCTIDGNMRMGGDMTSVTLSGVVKIGLGTSSGLILAKGMALNVSDLEAGSEIFVRTYGGAFTAAIPADKLETIAGYFKGAVRTELSVDTTANTINADQGTTGYCPHCYDPEKPEMVTWTKVTSNEFNGGHFYLGGAQVAASNFVFYQDTVLDLNGYTAQRTGRRSILSGAGVDVTVMDSCGGGRIIGIGTSETNNKYGAGFQFASADQTFTLLSGNLIMDSSEGTVQLPAGGLLHSYSTGTKIYIKGGVISGGCIKAESTTGGGNIYMSKTDALLEISAGIIKNGNSGTAASGGNIYTAGSVCVSGGVILGGTGKYGGNIYTDKEVEVSGGIIWGGTGTAGIGNIYTKQATISGGVIACGNAVGNGGNIRLSDATSSISGNAVIHSGKASGNAGNIFCVEKMTLNITGGLIAGGVAEQGGNMRQNSGNCILNISGGKISMGKATTGGNLYINNGTSNMTGGAVTAGTAKNGGNFYFNYNTNAVFKDDGKTNTALPVVSGGTATGGKGGNVAFISTGNTADASAYSLVLGNCSIRGGSASGDGDNLYVNQYAVFEVLPEFDQETSVYVHSSLIKEDIYLDNNYVTCDGVYSGTLYLENKINLPKIITTQTDPTMVIGQAALVFDDGTVVWYGSNASAVAAYTAQVSYIMPGSGELALPAGTFVIDLAGQNVTLTGDATAEVYCFDSANAAYLSYGTVVLNGPVLKNTVDYTAANMTFVTVAETDNNTYSFHRLGMRVSGVSLRSSSAGIYFSCVWECDSVLKTKLTHFGVAVSINDMPGNDFAEDGDTLYTQDDAENLQLGEGYNSVLINQILMDSATNNAARGTTPIYATPYVTLTSGENIVCAAEFSHSLQSTLKLFDNSAYYANKSVLESFYQKWESTMENWGFANIGVKPQDDDTIRILMIGNSFCSYYTDELRNLLMETRAEGITEVEVYNLYYSGRGMTAHYNLWKNQSAGDYDLFQVNKNGRFKLQPNGGWTLEDALAYANWDIISMQGMPSGFSYAEAEDLDPMCQELSRLAEALFGRIHEKFPYTRLMWHRTWCQEVGRVTDSGFEYTEEYNARYEPGMQYVCDYMTEVFDQDKPYDLEQVNSGAAWTEARRLNQELDALPYGGLCAMLARNTFGDGRFGAGDGQHDGDIGGGQLLNAYMWYMTITGDSDLTDNMFKPVYTSGSTDYEMSVELWNMLKQAAMNTYETYYK